MPEAPKPSEPYKPADAAAHAAALATISEAPTRMTQLVAAEKLRAEEKVGGRDLLDALQSASLPTPTPRAVPTDEDRAKAAEQRASRKRPVMPTVESVMAKAAGQRKG